MNQKVVGVIILLVVLVLGGLFFMNNGKQESISDPTSPRLRGAEGVIRYIPVGDSYTIGNGVGVEERWPNILVRHLGEEGINMELVTNPAVSGYTVSDALDLELPIVKSEKPDFVTLFIGANDSFRGGDIRGFRKELGQLIDELQKSMTEPGNLILITIPDYTISVQGATLGATEKERQSILDFNKVIKEEGGKRNLKVVDLFPASQELKGAEFYISDGLHPSAKGIEIWERAIFPVALELLKK